MKNQINQNYINNYDKDGFVVIRGLFAKKEAKKLEKKILSFLKNKINRYKGRDINFAGDKRQLKNLHSFHKLHDFDQIIRLSKNKKIKAWSCI